MDEDRHGALSRAIDAEHELVTRFNALNQQFSAALGTMESRRQLTHGERVERDATLHALAEQAHVLEEQLESVHRSYMDSRGAERESLISAVAGDVEPASPKPLA